MTTTYLGFFLNRQTKEEFVAPAVAGSMHDARLELYKAYPESRFVLITIYSREELENVLSSVDRWPGMPSKVQEPVRADLTKVRASIGNLPPLPGQAKPQQAQPATATVQAPLSAQGIPAWMQNLVTPQPHATKAVATPAISKGPALEQAMTRSQAATPQPLGQGASLIERLKAARGESMPKAQQQTIRREPTVDTGVPISRSAGSGSVIDILKGMRK